MNGVIALISVFLTSMFAIAICNRRKEMIGAALVSLMVLIPTFGYKIIQTPIMAVNATAPVYAAVLIGIVACTERFGTHYARSLSGSIFVGDLIFVFSAYVIAAMTCIHSDLDSAGRLLFSPAPRIAFASFMAFLSASYITIFVYAQLRSVRTHKVIAMLIAIAIGQFIDSFIFFPGAFANIEPYSMVVRLSIFGALNKIYISVLAIPFFVYATKKVTIASPGLMENIDPSH